MSIRHAANRFLKTSVHGWDGAAWQSNITRCSLLPNDRFISDREFGNKLRSILTNPSNPIPSNISLVKLGADAATYMVGRRSQDIRGSVYSELVSLRKAYYTGTITGFTTQTLASGMKASPVRTTLATTVCDREHVTFATSREYPGIRFGDEVVILPFDVPVNTSNEILISGKIYEVQEVFVFSGLQYCRSIVRPQLP